MRLTITVRRYRPGEEDALWSLLHTTVHRVNATDYSQAQLDAWAPQNCPTEWCSRLQRTQPLLALAGSELVGFAELEANGHIDCFYTAFNWQNKGVGGVLLKAIEREAVTLGLPRLYAEVSITAKDFFLRKGFTFDAERIVEIRGEQLTNYAMSRRLV